MDGWAAHGRAEVRVRRVLRVGVRAYGRHVGSTVRRKNTPVVYGEHKPFF
jgi:hypothetical protein